LKPASDGSLELAERPPPQATEHGTPLNCRSGLAEIGRDLYSIAWQDFQPSFSIVRQ